MKLFKDSKPDNNESLEDLIKNTRKKLGLKDQSNKIKNPEEIQFGEDINEILSALSSKDPKYRAAAALELCEIETDEAMKPLLSTLNDTDEVVSDNAAYALKYYNHPEVIEALLNIIKQDPDGTYSGAAYSLGELKVKTAVKPLIRMLKNPDWMMRDVAAEALGKIGDERAFKPLVDLLKNDTEVSNRIITRALCQLNKEKAIKVMLNYFKLKIINQPRDIKFEEFKYITPIATLMFIGVFNLPFLINLFFPGSQDLIYYQNVFPYLFPFGNIYYNLLYQFLLIPMLILLMILFIIYIDIITSKHKTRLDIEHFYIDEYKYVKKLAKRLKTRFEIVKESDFHIEFRKPKDPTKIKYTVAAEDEYCETFHLHNFDMLNQSDQKFILNSMRSLISDFLKTTDNVYVSTSTTVPP